MPDRAIHRCVLDQDTPDNSTLPRADFRSDTVTLPDDSMREAMAGAVVGDDGYGDDVSVNQLEESLAQRLGMDRAVFFPTGTQSNLAAILSHCQRGDAILVGENYHTYATECGGASALGGVAYCPLPVADDGGLDPEQITMMMQTASHNAPRPALLCLENTHAGQAVALERIQAAASTARSHGLAVHLDGARLFNAALELGADVAAMVKPADTVSVCLSKGLGAPAGTILCCPESAELQIRRLRKMLGGGMRQSGVLAAAGLHALAHNVDRLLDDHHRARILADRLMADLVERGVVISQRTNMVFFRPAPDDHGPLCDALLAAGLRVNRRTPTLRFVIHLDIDDDAINALAGAIRDYYREIRLR